MSETKDTLKVRALTQSIARVVANYEEQLAELRAEATITIEGLNDTIKTLQDELNNAKRTENEIIQEATVEDNPSE